jgi:hypothetical protein
MPTQAALGAGWSVTKGCVIRSDYLPSDGTCAAYLLCEAPGRTKAVLKGKRAAAKLDAA